MECFFCKIAKHEIPAEIIYEDDTAICVLDIHPHAPGHSMVIPRAHVETILELDNIEGGQVFLAVKKVVQLLKNKLAPDGFTIGINHGESAGQAVPHLHIHIIPRYKNDGGTSIHGVVMNPGKESIEEIKMKIKGNG